MKKVKKEFQVTFGYRAVITVNVTVENEEQAKTIALAQFNDDFRLPGAKNIDIQDDEISVAGVVNMSESWNAVR